jgi:hypothetical protein
MPHQKLQICPGSQRILRERRRADEEEFMARGVAGSSSPRQLQQTEQLQQQQQQHRRDGIGSFGQAQAPAAGREEGAAQGSPYLQRMEQQLRPASADAAFPFHPAITRRGHKAKPRFLEDLSAAEKARREHRLAEARAAAASRELRGATFKPQLSAETAHGAYAEVKPKLAEVRAAPDAYLAQVAEKARRMELRRAWAAREKEVRGFFGSARAPACARPLAGRQGGARFLGAAAPGCARYGALWCGNNAA